MKLYENIPEILALSREDGCTQSLKDLMKKNSRQCTAIVTTFRAYVVCSAGRESEVLCFEASDLVEMLRLIDAMPELLGGISSARIEAADP